MPIVGLFHAGLGVASNPDFTTALFPGFAAGLVYAAFAIVAVAALVITRGRLGFARRTIDVEMPPRPLSLLQGPE